MGRETRHYCLGEVLPFVVLLTVECTNAGSNILYKAAVTKGLSYHVFMVYSYAIAALLLLPLSYFYHRKTPLPPITPLLLGKLFAVGFLGFTASSLAYKGIAFSNATLNSIMSNLCPAITFILAILFRMEEIKITSLSSQAKIIGSIVIITGAFVVVFYGGPVLTTRHIHHRRSQHSQIINVSSQYSLMSAQSNWILGGALLVSSNIVVSLWYIVQAKVVKEFPAEFIIAFFYNLSAFIISVPVCFISEANLSVWNVPPDVQLLSILYSGIMASGLGIMVHTWGLHVKGPVYLALFKPFSIAVSAILGVIFLGDDLYLGCVIGSAIISLGFYTVIWGKSSEECNKGELSDDGVVPLLKHNQASRTKDNAIG